MYYRKVIALLVQQLLFRFYWTPTTKLRTFLPNCYYQIVYSFRTLTTKNCQFCRTLTTSFFPFLLNTYYHAFCCSQQIKTGDMMSRFWTDTSGGFFMTHYGVALVIFTAWLSTTFQLLLSPVKNNGYRTPSNLKLFLTVIWLNPTSFGLQQIHQVIFVFHNLLA
jgi:hypothetical protein